MLENPRLCNACHLEGEEVKAKRRNVEHMFTREVDMNGYKETEYVRVQVSLSGRLYDDHLRRSSGDDGQPDLCKRHWKLALQAMIDKL